MPSIQLAKVRPGARLPRFAGEQEQSSPIRVEVNPKAMTPLMQVAPAPCEFSHLAHKERLKRFGEAIDAIRTRVEADLGARDVTRVRRLNGFSRGMEVVGRALIHFSFEPIGFLAGVGALWIHKQLQAIEIGHTVLHGVYDHLEGGGRFNSKKFTWDAPMDEAAWRHGHNVEHHHFTNVAGKDPDIKFGPARFTEQTPHHFMHRLQFPLILAVMVPNFAFFLNLHFTGLNDICFGNGRAKEFEAETDRSWKAVKAALRMALRKFVPYYFKNYVFFPLLAGLMFWNISMFWKVLLGNWMAEVLRDFYTAATIYCGHIGEEVTDYPEGTRAKGKGEWYAMQVEATNNFEVCLPISILCGGLDRQIEHHLFPKLPPDRLRKIAPEVRAVCAAYGVPYRTGTWWGTLKKALVHMRELSVCELGRAAV
ncbi:MAG: fatty acid desaturase [Verrucomicrobiota bacterium]